MVKGPEAMKDLGELHPLVAEAFKEAPKTLKDAADKASAAAAGAAWVLLGSQLISIAATMFAAGWRRHAGARVVTEVRPRPAPMV